MNGISSRGALIVLEGCDRAGKTTLCRLLMESLRKDGRKVESMHFPNRQTATGIAINKYLEGKEELEDHAIHLLFSANRWEFVPRMVNLLNMGTTLIVDRYAYSGVAFSVSKQGMDLNWCKQSDSGLPRPDLVIFLDLPTEVILERGGFGEERYETEAFQSEVRKSYFRLQEENWKILNANKPIMQLLDVIRSHVDEISTKQLGSLKKLWLNSFDKCL